MIQRIGRYEIQAELGRGGFGQVFRAYDPEVGRLVAIKTLTTAGDPDILTRFRNEAAAAGKLRHQNIVVIYDFGEYDGSPYLVMELLDGEDLERLITAQRPLSLLQKLNIIEQSAAGLNHAHLNSIVHRDVKPANIMLLRDGTVKIMDFGIALLTQATAARITPKGSLIGTFPYMSPEQFLGSTLSDALTDVFAFGVTCYKLISGTHPFQAPEMAGLMYNVMNRPPPPLRTLVPECPEALEQTILRMLAKNRDDRYQSLDDVLFDLKPVSFELQREHAVELVGEAQRLIDAGELTSANVNVRRALELDASNRTARDLREKLQRLIRQKDVSGAVAALVNEGRERLQARQFDGAIQKFESALRVDKSNTEVHGLLQEARAALDRSQRASRLAKDAQESLARGDLTSAHRSALDAVALDPGQDALSDLVQRVQQQITSRSRERELRDGISHARGLLLLHNFDDAIAALSRLAQEFPESSEPASLLARARQEQQANARRERLRTAIEDAKDLIRKLQFEPAVTHLSELRREFPESDEVGQLLTYAEEELAGERRVAAVEQIAARARSSIAAGEFDSALSELRSALPSFPDAGVLRELIQTATAAKAKHEYDAALQTSVSRARDLLASRRYAEAAGVVDAFVRAYGDAAALQPLAKEAKDGLERQRRLAAIEKLMGRAQSLLDDGRAGSATEVLLDATRSFPDEPALTRLLDVAQGRLHQQQRDEAISAIITEAEALGRSKQFDRALETLDSGLRQYAGDARLLRSREAILASRNTYEAESRKTAAMEQARRLQAEGNFDGALAVVRAALGEAAHDAQLLELRQQIETGIEARERRAAQIRHLESRAEALIAEKRFRNAVEFLTGACAHFPEQRRFADLKAAAESQLAGQQRADAIANLDRDVRQLVQDARFGEAARLIRDAAARYGEDADLHRLQSTVDAAMAARERADQIAQALADARRLFAADDVAGGVRLLRESATRYPESSEIADLYASSKARVRELEKARRMIAEATAESERLVSKGDIEAALRVIGAALRQVPDARELLEIQERLAGERDQRNRAAAIEAALKQARIHEDAGRLELAVQTLQGAANQFGGEPRIQGALAALETRWETDRKKQQADAARHAAESLLNQGRYDDAIALLEKQARDIELDALLARARQERNGKLREELLHRAAALESEGRLDEALVAAQQSVQLYGAVQRSVEMQLRLQAALDTAGRRQAYDAARERLAELEAAVATASKTRLRTIAAQAREIASPFPGDTDIAAVAARINAVVAERLRPRERSIDWRWIGAGAGALAAIAAAAFLIPRATRTPVKSPAASTVAVSVRSDPPGASVRIQDRTCNTADCKFDLAPGTYEAEASLSGYSTGHRSFTVGSAQRTATIDIPLQPQPAPAASAQVEAAQGTLEVETGVPGAVVSVDGSPKRADNQGRLRLRLAAAAHAIAVASDTFDAPRRSVDIAAGQVQRIRFHPLPKLAQADARPPLPPAASAPVTPPKVTPAIQQPPVVITPRADVPSPQETEWAHLDRYNPEALRKFAAKYPTDARPRESLNRLADMAWNTTDKKQADSLRAFVRQFPDSSHSTEAQTALEQIARQRREEDARNKAAAAQQTSIEAALAEFNRAFASQRPQDVRRIWPGVQKQYLDALTAGDSTFTIELRPTGPPSIEGNTASIPCQRIITTVVRKKPVTNSVVVAVRLQKSGDRWLVADPLGTVRR